MNSNFIKEALALKHRSDVFITECKMGSGWAGVPILDGWACKKSFNKQKIIGYEIKVSRSDFLADNKWHKYLSVCNEFYFVCPKGMIKEDELPADVGLMYVYDTNNIRTVKKSGQHTIDDKMLIDTIKYIMFYRSLFSVKTFNNHHQKAQYHLKSDAEKVHYLERRLNMFQMYNEMAINAGVNIDDYSQYVEFFKHSYGKNSTEATK